MDTQDTAAKRQLNLWVEVDLVERIQRVAQREMMNISTFVRREMTKVIAAKERQHQRKATQAALEAGVKRQQKQSGHTYE